MTTKDSVQFSLRYAGPETENHLINASELARSLLGLSSAVDTIAHGSLKAEAKAELLVSAKFRQGSAIADLVLNVVHFSPSLFAGLAFTPSSARDFLSLIIDIVKLAKLFKGQDVPESALSESQDGHVTIQYNNCTFNSTQGAISMYGNTQVRGALHETFSPVSSGKVHNVDVLNEKGEQLETIDTEAAQYLPIPTTENAPSSSTHKNVLVTIRRVSLDDARGWSFSWDGTQFVATMRDQAFIQAVEERRYQFAHGDKLRVDIKMETNAKKASVKWYSDQVHELIPAKEEESMF